MGDDFIATASGKHVRIASSRPPARWTTPSSLCLSANVWFNRSGRVLNSNSGSGFGGIFGFSVGFPVRPM
jgi:hypothetical protein